MPKQTCKKHTHPAYYSLGLDFKSLLHSQKPSFETVHAEDYRIEEMGKLNEDQIKSFQVWSFFRGMEWNSEIELDQELPWW